MYSLTRKFKSLPNGCWVEMGALILGELSLKFVLVNSLLEAEGVGGSEVCESEVTMAGVVIIFPIVRN